MKHFVILSFLILLIGFTNSAASVEIQSQFKLNSSSNFKGYFYLGSDKQNHFFVEKWDYQKDVYFEVDKSQMKVNFEKPAKSTELPISITNKNSDIFSIYQYGKNKLILYVVKAT